MVLLFLLISCETEEVMPEYSESGEDIFAAYVNGELWLPKGRPHLFSTNLRVSYNIDERYGGGVLFIKAYRVTDTQDESIFLSMSGVNSEGVYSLDDPETGMITFQDEDCYYGDGKGYSDDVPAYREGTLEITKLDTINRIISGRFNTTLTKLGCDTIRINNGIFDFKL